MQASIKTELRQLFTYTNDSFTNGLIIHAITKKIYLQIFLILISSLPCVGSWYCFKAFGIEKTLKVLHSNKMSKFQGPFPLNHPQVLTVVLICCFKRIFPMGLANVFFTGENKKNYQKLTLTWTESILTVHSEIIELQSQTVPQSSQCLLPEKSPNLGKTW